MSNQEVLDRNFRASTVSYTKISQESIKLPSSDKVQKAVVLSRLIASKLITITLQDPDDIELYPRGDQFISYLDATDELFMKLRDRKYELTDVDRWNDSKGVNNDTTI